MSHTAHHATARRVRATHAERDTTSEKLTGRNTALSAAINSNSVTPAMRNNVQVAMIILLPLTKMAIADHVRLHGFPPKANGHIVNAPSLLMQPVVTTVRNATS